MFQVLCEGVEPGEGKVQECLRKKRVSLSWDCQEALFRKEVINLLKRCDTRVIGFAQLSCPDSRLVLEGVL